MSTARISLDLELSLARRLGARALLDGQSSAGVLAELAAEWIGHWGDHFAVHVVATGEDLRDIARRYYGDGELYLAIAYFNGIESLAAPLLPGSRLLVPEPEREPTKLCPEATAPWGVPKTTISSEIGVELHRRLRARTALGQTTLTDWLYQLVAEWCSEWPGLIVEHVCKPGDTLTGLASLYYDDAGKYPVIACFNGLRDPSAIRVGQRLAIPEPTCAVPLPPGESPYIFGIHDRGGERLMADLGKRGWILITEELGRNPTDECGASYDDLERSGFGVLVRLNHGYHRGASFPGTIPEHDSEGQSYREFAARCGNFVAHSSGCHIWIIGNEMNHPNEWPGGEQGQMITPELYAECFRHCRAEIQRREGHEMDQVIVGAVAPWPDKARYPGNERGDWVRYLADLLGLLRGQCDGIALHTYTHGPDRELITSEERMAPPFEDRRFQFRAYQDFMAGIPPSMRALPVYITETDQNDPWAHRNTGWVRAAYAEINEWNRDLTRQKIRCLLLYRWLRHDQWSFRDIKEVTDDFRAAMSTDYRWWR